MRSMRFVAQACRSDRRDAVRRGLQHRDGGLVAGPLRADGRASARDGGRLDPGRLDRQRLHRRRRAGGERGEGRRHDPRARPPTEEEAREIAEATEIRFEPSGDKLTIKADTPKLGNNRSVEHQLRHRRAAADERRVRQRLGRDQGGRPAGQRPRRYRQRVGDLREHPRRQRAHGHRQRQRAAVGRLGARLVRAAHLLRPGRGRAGAGRANPDRLDQRVGGAPRRPRPEHRNAGHQRTREGRDIDCSQLTAESASGGVSVEFVPVGPRRRHGQRRLDLGQRERRAAAEFRRPDRDVHDQRIRPIRPSADPGPGPHEHQASQRHRRQRQRQPDPANHQRLGPRSIRAAAQTCGCSTCALACLLTLGYSKSSDSTPGGIVKGAAFGVWLLRMVAGPSPSCD